MRAARVARIMFIKMSFHLPKRRPDPATYGLLRPAVTEADLGARLTVDVAQNQYFTEKGLKAPERGINVHFEPRQFAASKRLQIRQNIHQSNSLFLAVVDWRFKRGQSVFCERSGATSCPARIAE